ncbi:MAG: exodeoxyribonuclease VII small subunit [Actinomycetota bacterium]
MTTEEIGYAAAISELDAILAELDDDDIDIDTLSERVERAAELIAVCRSRIGAAQQRVSAIVETIEADGPGESSADTASPIAD